MAHDDSSLDILVEFSRLVSDASGPEDVWPTMLRAALEHLRADAAAVVEIRPDGTLRVAAKHGLPPAADEWAGGFDDLGELASKLEAAAGASFDRSYTLPLVAGGDLFGALALYFAAGRDLDAGETSLARALVDLAALAIQRAVQEKALRDSYEELKASRELLARSEKLSALGQMAATVSHDLKNIFNPLGLQLEVLRRRVDRDPAGAREVIERLDSVVKHGVQTLERLRAFSRQEDRTQRRPAKLDELVEGALALCSADARARRQGVTLRRDYGAPPEAAIEPSEVTNAAVNLIVNAFDVSDDGGEVAVRTGAGEDTVWFEVSDSGPGIPDDIRERLFEPFVTTKGESGTGLGLAMVYSTVKRHGGEVSVETGDGGTTFRVTLPVP